MVAGMERGRIVLGRRLRRRNRGCVERETLKRLLLAFFLASFRATSLIDYLTNPS